PHVEVPSWCYGKSKEASPALRAADHPVPASPPSPPAPAHRSSSLGCLRGRNGRSHSGGGLGPAPQDVPVQMKHGLAGPCSDIDENAVVGQPHLLCGLGDELEHPLRFARIEL